MENDTLNGKQSVKTKIILGIVFFLLVAFDQWTKHLAVAKLKGTAGFSLLEDIFSLQYLENYGAAFGVMQNKRWILLCVTVIILIALLWGFFKIPSTRKYMPLQICIVLLGAGAVGNIIDRLIHGFVIDMLNFELIDFPIFNVADCYVTVSEIFALYLIFFYYKEEELTIFKRKKSK